MRTLIGSFATLQALSPGEGGAGGRVDEFVWWVTGVFVAVPIKSFSAVFSFILVVVVIVAATGNAGNSEESSHSWDMNSDLHVKQVDIINDLRDRTDVISVSYSEREVALSGLNLIVAYETEDGKDIFTAANVQRMCKVEAKWFGNADYASFCHLAGGGTCMPPYLSTVALFYGSADMSWAESTTDMCPLLDESSVAATRDAMYAALATDAGLLQYGFFAGADFVKKGYTSRSRSLLQVGGPLEGYSVTLDDDDDQPEQEALYEDFFVAVQKDLVHMLGMEAGFMRSIYRDDTLVDGKVEAVWYSWILTGSVFEELINGDLQMVIFSVLFVWIWMNVHLESCFVASVGMLQIFLSLPFGRLFYSIIGQVKYFSTLQSLAIFLVLGIGADDVFVLVDGWKQSAVDVPRRSGEADDAWLHRRLADSYSRTMQAVFNTSFTTAMAFISTAISPVMPISAFGIYASICIVINYLFVISLTPPAIIIHHKFMGGFGPKGWCGIKALFGAADMTKGESSVTPAPGSAGGEKQQVELTPVEPADFKPARSPSLGFDSKPIAVAEVGHGSGDPALLELTSETDTLSRVLVTLFEYEAPDAWGALGGVKVASVASVAVCLTLAAVFSVFAAGLDLPVEQEQWFPLDHMVQRFIDGGADFLAADASNYPSLNLVWGARPNIERTDFNQWEPDKNRGEARFDPNFDLANPLALAAVSKACAQLSAKACGARGCKPFGTLVASGSVLCPVDEFEAWHLAMYNTSAYSLGAKSVTFYSRLLTFRSTTSPAANPYATWEDTIGVIDGEFKYLVVSGTMTLDYRSSNVVKKDVLDVTLKLLDAIDTPSSAHHVLQVSQVWVWYATNDALLEGMLLGLAIAFPVAFATLIFATHNVLIATYAIITIAAIVGSVLGAAERQGWALGVAESIAAVIVVGFSVDYTIHLGHMYDHAGHHGGYALRSERARYALLKMGSTVLAGAITTCGSGVFMFACQLVFFNKMAFLICCTIAFSLAFSLFLFVPLLYLVGPSETSGDVSHFIPGMKKPK